MCCFPFKKRKGVLSFCNLWPLAQDFFLMCTDYLHFLHWAAYREVNKCTAFLGHPTTLHTGHAFLFGLAHPRRPLLQIQVSSTTSTFAARCRALCLLSTAGHWRSAAGQEMGTGWSSPQVSGPRYADWRETGEWKIFLGLPMVTNCKAISFPEARRWHRRK